MARHGPVLFLGRALPDRYCIDYSSPRLPSVVVVLARRVIRLLHRWSISSFFRTPQGLDEQALWIVSWDTRIVLSSPCSALSQPDTCCGDHRHCSFSATNSRSGLLGTKRATPRQFVSTRRSISSAPAIPNNFAADRGRRAVQPTGDGPQRDSPATRPRDISSRSPIVSDRRLRCLSSGAIPPLACKTPKIEPACLPNERPISLSDWPLFRRAQSSRF